MLVSFPMYLANLFMSNESQISHPIQLVGRLVH